MPNERPAGAETLLTRMRVIPGCKPGNVGGGKGLSSRQTLPDDRPIDGVDQTDVLQAEFLVQLPLS